MNSVAVFSPIVYGWWWSRFNRSTAQQQQQQQTLKDQSAAAAYRFLWLLVVALGLPFSLLFLYIVVVATYRTTWKTKQDERLSL